MNNKKLLWIIIGVPLLIFFSLVVSSLIYAMTDSVVLSIFFGILLFFFMASGRESDESNDNLRTHEEKDDNPYKSNHHKPHEVFEKKYKNLDLEVKTSQHKNIPISAKRLASYGIDYLYHMTDIDNLPSIIDLGLLPHNNRYVIKEIDNKEVNQRRDRNDPIYGRNIHKYVPFYFNPKNPMLYVNKNNQKDIVILAFNKDLFFEQGVVFTDGNAARRDTKFFNSLEDLKKINWDCIRAEYWNTFENGKSERMAEVLVPYRVGCESLCHIICYDNYTLSKVKRMAPGVEVLIDKEKFF